MAAWTQINPVCVGSNVQHVMQRDYICIDGAATWKKGQFLRRASDGLLYAAVTATTSLAASAITHFALATVSSAYTVDTHREWVGILHQDDIFEMHTKDATATTEATNGLQRALYVASNICTVNMGSGTYATLKIIRPTWAERGPEDDSDDTYSRVLVNPLKTAINATPTT